MNNKDLLMLAALREDARASFAEMSKKTGIPASTLFDRIKTYEGSLIKKHTSLIDFGKLGFGTIVKIALKVDRADRETLREFLMNHRNLNSVYGINNGFDFMVEGVFRNLKEMREFTENLRENFKIEVEQVYFVIEELKKEGFLDSVERVRAAED